MSIFLPHYHARFVQSSSANDFPVEYFIVQRVPGEHTLCFFVSANRLFPDSKGYGGCCSVKVACPAECGMGGSASFGWGGRVSAGSVSECD